MIGKLLSLFSGGATGIVATGVVNVASLLALAPAAVWFVENKDGVLVTITWGEAAVFGGIIAAFIKLAHYTTKAP